MEGNVSVDRSESLLEVGFIEILDENLFKFQILFSDIFRKSFQKLKCSSVKKSVIKLLLKLASGWRPKNINVDRKCENSTYIVKQLKVDEFYVVCSVDIIKDSVYKQVLKVWDVLPMMETTKLFERLDSISSMYSDDFINCCNDKCFEGDLEVPRSWSLSRDIIRLKNTNTNKFSSSAGDVSVECRSVIENSNVSESLLLMKFYSLSIDAVNHFLLDLEGGEVDLPFEVTDEEREIIIFPKSSFILGRSGTGKTTILTMKLFQKLQQYHAVSRDSVADDNSVYISNVPDVDQPIDESRGATLHQLFVTVSPKLCYSVKKHVSDLQNFAIENFSGSNNFTGMDDNDDEMAEFKDIPDTFVCIKQEKYPLIITFHKFLMMLDGTLGNSYFQRFHGLRNPSECEGRRSVSLSTFMRKNEVTYDRFLSLYWPRFNKKLTKNLDASRVFTEIMSHIKGGLQEGEACDCKRSREDYISFSDSRASTLSSKTRGVIYDIFEDYEKRKLERVEFDLADFVMDIHLRLKNEDLLGDKMDFVYIDEVQDLTMRQISLFRYICKNVSEGFIFSGDTAQTIARGIDFRFEDIRSLFYNEFLMKSRNYDISGRREKGLISDMFTLSQNFRTHTGVLKLAQSIIDLICHFFPQSIDSLAPETSLIYGESPVVLEPGSDENIIKSIFGCSQKAGGKWVGFGADQVILVRNECARDEISSYVGNQALVLTILESKGLEFQDVLLYNFFGSSPVGNKWRVVYEFMKQKDILDGHLSKSFPRFSLSRHNILCSELKQLYVAITRTRQRLWICENNVELSEPMVDYWRRLCLVQVRKVDDSLSEAMQKDSSPEDWKSQGIKLFWEKNYKMATMCFEKAGEETWEKRAKASALRAAADSLHGSNSKEAIETLRKAAEIFDSIDRAESAAECFCDSGDYERAGRIYLEKCGVSGLRKAGDCFCLSGSYKTASEVYAKGNFFKECLSAFREGNCFDLGLQYIEYWKEQASLNSMIIARLKEIDKIAEEFLENCALECYKAKDIASLMKFVRAFDSMESKRIFLKSLDCHEKLLVLEEESGNFSEAAEIAKSIGDIPREIDLLEKAGEFENACLLIISYVLSNCLWLSGRVKLLNRAMSDAQKVSETFHAAVCVEVKILIYEKMNLSELMQYYCASKQYDITAGKIYVRKLLDAHFEVNPPKYECDPELHLDETSFSERILRSQVSIGTLVYLWNLWKQHSLEILEYLDSLEGLDFNKSGGIARFCFIYFGVRLLDNSSVTFQLLNPDAMWVKCIDKRLTRRKGKVVTLEARHFASVARKFWHQELVSVGLEVLELLQKIYKSSIITPLRQTMCLLHIFDIGTFFYESKSIETTSEDAKRLQSLVVACPEYLNLVFQFDHRPYLSEDMISLRETELSKNLLEEIVSQCIDTRSKLSYEQIGMAMMVILGTGKPKHGLYDRISGRLPKKSSWKSFFKMLYSSKECEYVLESPMRCSLEALIREFHKALEETYEKDWTKHNSMQPHCFFYLVERLLILVPHSQDFFFVKRSSLVEFLISLPSNASPRSCLVMDKNSKPTSMLNFVVNAVEQSLNSISDRVICAEQSPEFLQYFQELLLKLFGILCLLCLNWNMPLKLVTEKLTQSQFNSPSPREFYEALQRTTQSDNTSYVSSIADAFKAIDDPLVIVALSENNLKFAYPNAIFLDPRSFSCKDKTIKILFPRNHGNSTIVESETDIKLGPEKVINWGLIRELSDALESLRNRNDEYLKSLVLRKKVEVVEHLNSLIAQLRNERSEDKDLQCEESSTLCSLLATNDFDCKGSSDIAQVMKSLEAKRPQLDTLVSMLNVEKDPNKKGKIKRKKKSKKGGRRKQVKFYFPMNECVVA